MQIWCVVLVDDLLSLYDLAVQFLMINGWSLISTRPGRSLKSSNGSLQSTFPHCLRSPPTGTDPFRKSERCLPSRLLVVWKQMGTIACSRASTTTPTPTRLSSMFMTSTSTSLLGRSCPRALQTRYQRQRNPHRCRTTPCFLSLPVRFSKITTSSLGMLYIHTSYSSCTRTRHS